MTYIFYSIDNVNKDVEVKSNNINAVKNTKFNGAKPTLIIIHGYYGNGRTSFTTGVVKAMASGHHDWNLISLDWEPIWKNNDMNVVISTTPTIGQYIATFLKELSSKFSLNISKLQIVGHSYGGYIAAKAGSALGGQLEAVIGLDPYPGLAPSDAKRVEVSITLLLFKIKYLLRIFRYLDYPHHQWHGCQTSPC